MCAQPIAPAAAVVTRQWLLFLPSLYRFAFLAFCFAICFTDRGVCRIWLGYLLDPGGKHRSPRGRGSFLHGLSTSSPRSVYRVFDLEMGGGPSLFVSLGLTHLVFD